MSRRQIFIQLLILSGIAVLLFAGCGTQKEIDAPVEMPDSFSESGTSLVPDKWWTEFDDPQLNTVIDTAMQSNFNLLTAFQRLQAAQAVVGILCPLPRS